MKILFFFCIALTITIFSSGCATTTRGGALGIERKQLLLMPAEQIENMSSKGYEDMKKEAAQKKILDQNTEQVRRVDGIVSKLIAQTSVFRSDAKAWRWESHVIKTMELNAFCMPGGKMMIYTGLIDQLRLTDDEIAAVMGHEIAHALREHGRERLSQEMLKQGGLQILIATGKLDPKYAAAAGAVSALILTLPHSRSQESEADQIGLELMARAGFDPKSAVTLWRKMGAAEQGPRPPEFLSTHPSGERRIRTIEEMIPKVTPLYEKTRNVPGKG